MKTTATMSDTTRIDKLQAATEAEFFAQAADEAADPKYIVTYDPAKRRGSIRIDLRTMIAERIRSTGIRQQVLADAIGIHQPTLAQFLSGKRNLPLPQIEQLMALLDIM